MKLYTNTNCTNENVEYPRYAVIEVTPELVARVKQLQGVVASNALERAVVWGGPDKWENENVLKIRGGATHVDLKCMWFSAYMERSGIDICTSTVSIEALERLLGLPPSDGQDQEMIYQDGVVYFDIDPDDVAEYIREAETN